MTTDVIDGYLGRGRRGDRAGRRQRGDRRRLNTNDAVDERNSDDGGANAFNALHRQSVSVVIATLNEARNLPYVLSAIPRWVHEVILVDGRSTDNTVEVARELCPGVRVLTEEKPGKGVALRRGFNAATGDIIVTFDADGSHDPAEIPLFIGALLSGADFVKGSRFIQGGGTDDMEWYRRVGNWAFKILVSLNFGGRYTDLCYGFNAFSTSVLSRLNLDADGFEIETQMNIRALREKLKICEVASFEAARKYGVSNLRTFPDGWRVLKVIVNERFSIGSRTVSASEQ